MRTPELFRSTAFRLASTFALAIILAMTAVFAIVYLEIATSDVGRLRVVLVDEAAKGVGESDEELRRALELRLTRDLRRLDYVALFGKDGALVFGNVTQMPAIPVDGDAHLVNGARSTVAENAAEATLFVARRRADGGVLLLGRSLVEVYAVRGIVLRALVIGLVPTTLLSLAIGAIFARRASLRLAMIRQTIDRIMRGDLNARLPVRGSGDEIENVARAVNSMLDELVRLLDQLKSAGDNIAHDLRTPLAIMRAKLERALAEQSNHQALRDAAMDSLAQIDKAVASVAALLRISAVESALRSSAFREIDLVPICADLFEFYEPLARSKAIEMTLEESPTALMQGDADLLREAISNLLDNAIKFTPSGGAIRLEVAVERGRPMVRVVDSGCGVPAEEQEKIFERFYRGGREQRPAGNGLGLSIAKTIANLHGLKLTVKDNAPGSRFELS
jgi:signal transduction histidine kinase